MQGYERCDLLYLDPFENPTSLSDDARSSMIPMIQGNVLTKSVPMNPNNYKSNRSYCYFLGSNNFSNSTHNEPLFACNSNTLKAWGNPTFITRIFPDSNQEVVYGDRNVYNKCTIEIDKSKLSKGKINTFWRKFAKADCDVKLTHETQHTRNLFEERNNASKALQSLKQPLQTTLSTYSNIVTLHTQINKCQNDVSIITASNNAIKTELDIGYDCIWKGVRSKCPEHIPSNLIGLENIIKSDRDAVNEDIKVALSKKASDQEELFNLEKHVKKLMAETEQLSQQIATVKNEIADCTSNVLQNGNPTSLNNELLRKQKELQMILTEKNTLQGSVNDKKKILNVKASSFQTINSQISALENEHIPKVKNDINECTNIDRQQIQRNIEHYKVLAQRYHKEYDDCERIYNEMYVLAAASFQYQQYLSSLIVDMEKKIEWQRNNTNKVLNNQINSYGSWLHEFANNVCSGGEAPARTIWEVNDWISKLIESVTVSPQWCKRQENAEQLQQCCPFQFYPSSAPDNASAPTFKYKGITFKFRILARMDYTGYEPTEFQPTWLLDQDSSTHQYFMGYTNKDFTFAYTYPIINGYTGNWLEINATKEWSLLGYMMEGLSGDGLNRRPAGILVFGTSDNNRFSFVDNTYYDDKDFALVNGPSGPYWRLTRRFSNSQTYTMYYIVFNSAKDKDNIVISNFKWAM